MIGYLWEEEEPVLERYASLSPGVLVEIGSFAGKSLTRIVAGAQHPVVSIDHHRGNPEMQPGQACFLPEAWDDEAGMVDSLPLLRRNMAGVEDKVTLIAAPSAQVAQWWTTPIGFLFIDGNHDDSRTDYDLWSRHLLPDAYLLFHDTEIPEIAGTVAQAESDGWKVVETVHDCLKVLTR